MSHQCPSGDEIKYRMTRVAMDALDFYLLEANTALHLWVSAKEKFFKECGQYHYIPSHARSCHSPVAILFFFF
jgi:hypothetical protein